MAACDLVRDHQPAVVVTHYFTARESLIERFEYSIEVGDEIAKQH